MPVRSGEELRAGPAHSYREMDRAAADGIWVGNRAGAAAARSAGAGASASAASTANAATSTRPATMPAVVRTSFNPSSPTQTDRR
jgi:hypothetical protein